ncbi:hypothetical protein [Streptomyces sp. NPDC000618]|uniref:hypothetical protein n=1 Tax=Streptomyces sp. NPDC000618 TaxID=3154265 RepID=UPI00331AE5F3
MAERLAVDADRGDRDAGGVSGGDVVVADRLRQAVNACRKQIAFVSGPMESVAVTPVSVPLAVPRSAGRRVDARVDPGKRRSHLCRSPHLRGSDPS